MQEHPPSGMFNVTIRLSTHCTILHAKGMSLQIDFRTYKRIPLSTEYPSVLLSYCQNILLFLLFTCLKNETIF